MKTNEESHHFISTDSVKSWASAIDKASKLRATGNFRILVTLLSRSRLLAPTFVFRNHKLKKIANQNDFSLKIIEFPISMKTSSLLLSLFLTLRIKLSNGRVKPFTDSKLLAICDAYWAAKLGSQGQNPAFLSFRFVFLPIYLCLLYSKFLLSKQGATALSQQEEGIFYVWNGREPAEAFILNMLRDFGRTYQIIERGAIRDSYEMWLESPHFQGEWWHKLSKNESRLESLNFPETEKEIALRYAKAKSSGFDPTTGRDWTTLMGKRLEFKSNKPYVVFFSSSTKELSPIKEFIFESPLGDQFEAVRQLARVTQRLDIQLVIRRHPNSVSRSGNDLEKTLWAEFCGYSKVELINPEEEFDSYQLASNALCSYVWVSTIGFDLICKGFNVRTLGPAFWAYQEEFRAFNADLIERSIKEEVPEIVRQRLIINYSNFMTTRGEHYGYFREVSKGGARILKNNQYLAVNDFRQFKSFCRLSLHKVKIFCQQLFQ